MIKNVKDIMANLMVFPEEESEEQLLLLPEDFPDFYINFAHPDDYKTKNGRIQDKELIFNHRQGRHNRLLARIPWNLDKNDQYTMFTFVLDTGAPKHIYLCKRAISLLEEKGLILEDKDSNIIYVNIHGRKCPIEPTPLSHEPANLIGLKMLMRLKIKLFEENPCFSFDHEFLHF